MNTDLDPHEEKIYEPKRIWNKMFVGAFFASAAMTLSSQLSNSMLSVYADAVGAPPNQIGSLMSMFALTALIFRFVSGPAMNSFNRKKLLLIGMSFFISSYLGYAAAPKLAEIFKVPVIHVLKVFRLIQGVGNAFGNTCVLTIVSDYIPKAKFASGMGIFACAQVASQAIGPTIGVLLRDLFGYTNLYIIIACMMGCALAIVSLIIRVAPHPKVPFKLTPGNMVAAEALVPAVIIFLIHRVYYHK